jgi:shikimate 5-dehydrogenase
MFPFVSLSGLVHCFILRQLNIFQNTCRNQQRAEALAAALGDGAETADLAAVRDSTVFGDVLVNTTSVGMSPGDDESPVPKSALAGYRLVFDAVYTPPQTRLLKVWICFSL